MKTLLLSGLILLSCAPMTNVAFAQSTVTETFYAIPPMERKVGHQHREDLDAIWLELQRGDTASADERLEPVLSYCEAQHRQGLRLVSVATVQEYEQYMAENANGEPTEWIDVACPMAYKLKGFLLAGAKDNAEAIRWLDKAIALAPYFADAHVERGFALGQDGNLDEALAAYRRALALANEHPSAAHARPLALRGTGWVLVEMGDLDGAQRAYEASLEIDPDSKLAKSELEYIAKLREASR